MSGTVGAGITGPGEYAPAGEAQGGDTTFDAAAVAAAFGSTRRGCTGRWPGSTA